MARYVPGSCMLKTPGYLCQDCHNAAFTRPYNHRGSANRPLQLHGLLLFSVYGIRVLLFWLFWWSGVTWSTSHKFQTKIKLCKHICAGGGKDPLCNKRDQLCTATLQRSTLPDLSNIRFCSFWSLKNALWFLLLSLQCTLHNKFFRRGLFNSKCYCENLNSNNLN